MAWTYPKTWNVGDSGASADFNTYVRDNLNWLNPASQTFPTLAPGWAAFGAPYQSWGYFQQGNVVIVQGVIKNTQGTAIGPPSTIITVPTPAQRQSLSAEIGGGTRQRVDVIPGSPTRITMIESSVPAGQFFVISGAYSLI